jgi:hypothetical protein
VLVASPRIAPFTPALSVRVFIVGVHPRIMERVPVDARSAGVDAHGVLVDHDPIDTLTGAGGMPSPSGAVSPAGFAQIGFSEP